MKLLSAFWSDAQASGARPKPVYGVFEGEALVFWTLSRRQATQYLASKEAGLLIKLTPA
jgi:hypothetical protein